MQVTVPSPQPDPIDDEVWIAVRQVRRQRQAEASARARASAAIRCVVPAGLGDPAWWLIAPVLVVALLLAWPVASPPAVTPAALAISSRMVGPR